MLKKRLLELKSYGMSICQTVLQCCSKHRDPMKLTTVSQDWCTVDFVPHIIVKIRPLTAVEPYTLEQKPIHILHSSCPKLPWVTTIISWGTLSIQMLNWRPPPIFYKWFKTTPKLTNKSWHPFSWDPVSVTLFCFFLLPTFLSLCWMSWGLHLEMGRSISSLLPM